MKLSYLTRAVFCLGFCLTGPFAFALGAGKQWVWRNPTVQGAPLYAVTGTGSQVVAVGGGGTIVTAKDGNTWTTQSSGVSMTLYGIAYGNRTYAAVGQNGTIVTSTDGTTWTVRTSGVGMGLNAVAFGNNLFVAVGNQGTVVTSSDGIEWTKRSIIAQNTLYTVAWSGESFIAFDGAACLISPDGVTWRTVNLTTSNLDGGALNSLKSIAYGAGLWVVAGRDVDADKRGYAGFYSSTDGGQWSVQRITTAAALSAIIFDGHQFVAVGASGVVLTSPEGRTWTARSAGTSDTLYAVYWSGTRYYAVGDGGRIYVSSDADNWAFANNNSAITTNHLRGVAWTGSQFLAVGEGGAVLRSRDGATWQVATVEGSPALNAIAYNGSMYAAVGDGGVVFTSTDAVDWTSRTSRTTARLIGVTWSRGSFVAVGKGVMLLSSDGVKWSDNFMPAGDFNSLAASMDGNTLFVAGAYTTYLHSGSVYVEVSHPTAYLSTNGGYNWVQVLDTTAIGTLRGAAVGNGLCVAVNTSAWVGFVGLPLQGCGSFESAVSALVHGSGDWIAVGTDGGVYSATDPAATWTRRASGTDVDLTAIATNGARFVAVGNNGTILSSDADSPPVIVTQPASVTANLGWFASLSVTATGAEPLTYSWTRNDVAIAGATASTLAIDNVAATDAGTYQVTVKNGSGRVVSSTAILSINPLKGTAPQITVQPLTVNAANNGTVALNVGATGTSPLQYQWFKDGRIIAGATSDQLLVTQPGTYAARVGNAAGGATSSGAVVTFAPGLSRLSNLSVRTLLKSDQMLIVGVTTNQAKSVLFRAVGPGLSPYGVSNYCPDPRAELYSGTTLVASNDNWGGTPELRDTFVRTGAFALPGTSSDAAIISTVNGSCTAQIRGTGDGVLMFEMYDAGTGTNARLTNASTRNFAGTKESMLIAGFVVDGSVAKTLLIRGIGPALRGFGVSGALTDPQIDVCDQGGKVLAENNDWGAMATTAAAFRATGAFALADDSKDSAMLITIPPGLYTVQVSGADGGTGEALIEIYEMP